MTWNTNYPLSTTKLREYPGGQRANNIELALALAAGHTFPGTYGVDSGNHPNGMTFFDSLVFYDMGSDEQGRLYMDNDYIYIDGVRALAWAQLAKFKRASALPEIEFLLCTQWAYLPAGTVMLFGSRFLPENWSEPGSKKNDRVLRVVSGTGAGIGGSWAVSGVTLANAGIGPHTHTFEGLTELNAVAAAGILDPSVLYSVEAHQHLLPETETTSVSDIHNHALTFVNTWRPSYYNVIEGVKD